MRLALDCRQMLAHMLTHISYTDTLCEINKHYHNREIYYFFTVFHGYLDKKVKMV